MNSATEQLAIIRNPSFGASDRSVILTFDAYITESSAALQVLSVTQAVKALEDADTDVNGLAGKPCWVEVDGMMIKYLRMWKK